MEKTEMQRIIEETVTNGVGYARSKLRKNTEWRLQTHLCELERNTAGSPRSSKKYGKVVDLMKDIGYFNSRNGITSPRDVLEIDKILRDYSVYTR